MFVLCPTMPPGPTTRVRQAPILQRLRTPHRTLFEGLRKTSGADWQTSRTPLHTTGLSLAGSKVDTCCDAYGVGTFVYIDTTVNSHLIQQGSPLQPPDTMPLEPIGQAPGDADTDGIMYADTF